MRYRIIIIAAAAVLSAGCSKETAPGEEGRADGLKFIAAIENTKTVLSSDDKVNWSEGDVISINGVAYKASVDEVSPTVAEFEKVDPADPDPDLVDGRYKAYYPASLLTSSGASLPAVQTYAAGGDISGVNPMYAESAVLSSETAPSAAQEAVSLTFSNICGILELAVSGSGTVAGIEVRDRDLPLSGAFTPADGVAVMTQAAIEAGAGFSLDCGSGAALGEATGTSGGATIFRIAVPQAEYSGLEIKITATDGRISRHVLKTGVTAAIKAGTIYEIPLTAVFEQPGALEGIFTVGEGRKVRFASGNLFSTADGYGFESDQYGYAGDISESHNSRFAWNEGDWGAEYCRANGLSQGSWRTLSGAEWRHLLEKRTMAAGSRATNTVSSPVSIDGKPQRGLFIYPDDYAGIDVDDSFTWEMIASLGIVFLPAAGCSIDGAAVEGAGKCGYYWAADALNPSIAYNCRFSGNGTSAYNAFGTHARYAVRLVTDVL